MPRFVNLCRKDMVENWRSNVLRIALMYGVMTVVLLWGGYLEYRYKDTLVNDDSLWRLSLVLFMWCLWGFGCLSASFTMEKMKTKTSRLSALMTPATPFENYFSRWLVSTFVFLVVFLIAFRMADYTRVLVYSLTYPDLEAIASVPLSHLVGDHASYYTLFRETRDFTLVLALYFFFQSCFVLGSSIWPKNAFLKTFVAGAIIAAVYGLVGAGMINLLEEMSPSNSFNPGKDMTYTLLNIAACSFTLLNWTLAYFRFKESEIITRM